MGQAPYLIGALLLVSSWLTTEHFLPWVSWHAEAGVFLAVLLLAWCGLGQSWSRNVRRTIALPLVCLPFAALALVAIVQRATGLLAFDGDVWVLCFYVMLCIACMTLGYAAATPSTNPHAGICASGSIALVAWTLLLGAVLSTVVAFAQVFGLWEHSGWIVRMPDLRRPGGNMAQPNHLATLQVMGVASAVFLRKSLGSLGRGLILFLLCFGIAVSESRTGALSLLALLCWWLIKRRALDDGSSAWLGVIWGIGFLGVFIAWPDVLNAMDLLGYQAAGRLREGSPRFEVWSQLLHAAGMRPWAGWGVRQVVAAHNAVVDQYAVTEPYAYSHNVVLDLVMWVGVPLALLFTTVAAIYFWRRANGVNGLLPWYGLAVVLPLAVHSMFEYPFAYAYFLAPAMFLLGTVEASLGAKPLMDIGVKSAVALLTAMTIVLAWSAAEYLGIEEDFRVARFEALRIGATPPEHVRPTIVLLDQLGLLLEDTRVTPKPGMPPEAMQLVKDAALHYPWSATQYRYAVALALNGDPVEAKRQMQVIRSMWGEKVYKGIKEKVDGLAATEYPQLRQLTNLESKVGG